MRPEDLLQLDQQARQRAVSLEAAGRLPAGFTERHYPLTRLETAELRRLKAAGYAATDVDTFIALCKGDIVPAERLNRKVIRYHKARNTVGR